MESSHKVRLWECTVPPSWQYLSLFTPILMIFKYSSSQNTHKQHKNIPINQTTKGKNKTKHNKTQPTQLQKADTGSQKTNKVNLNVTASWTHIPCYSAALGIVLKIKLKMHLWAALCKYIHSLFHYPFLIYRHFYWLYQWRMDNKFTFLDILYYRRYNFIG